MDSINKYEGYGCIVQDDVGKSLEIKSDSSLTQVVTTGSAPTTSMVYNKDFYSGCKFSFGTVTVSEGREDDFLQAYAIECGYKFTEDFLSTMSKHRINFVEKIDPVLTSNFSFLKEILSDSNVVELKGKIYSSFYENIHDLRSKCVNVLTSDIIPASIESIFDSNIIVGDSDSKMTYPEMERLFLYFVGYLEKLIVVKITKCWNNFCSKNELMSSLILYTNYSVLLSYDYHFDRSSLSNITHPAAFDYKFSEYISLMAIAKIDEMMGNFVDKCTDALEKLVYSKCCCVLSYSNSTVNDLMELKAELESLIKKEFDKKIIEERVKYNFSDFLNKLVIWDRYEGIKSNRVLIFDGIIGSMYKLLLSNSAKHLSIVIRRFQKRAWKARSRLLKGGKCFTIEGRWGIKLHPEDNYNILSIMSKFTAKSRSVVRGKFFSMIREKYKFPDGTVISMIKWDKISKNLFPIAQETIRSIIEVERAELSRFLFDVRVLEDASLFDGGSAGTRKATAEERDSILKIFTNRIHCKNRHLFSRIWSNLINVLKNNSSEDVVELGESEEEMDSAIDSMLIPMGNVGGLVSSSEHDCSSTSSSLTVESQSKGSKSVDMWGLNIHPDDDKIVSFIRKKFARDISTNLRELFSSMLESGAVLPSGRIVSKCSWSDVSSELVPIALVSVESIFKGQCAELDSTLSKVRVLEVGREDGSSSSFRVVTNDEKHNLMLRAISIVRRSLMCSIRSSWVYLTKISRSYTCRGESGVELRHSDDIVILNIRRKYSHKIKSKICDKFSDMMRDDYRFDDGTVVGKFPWFKVHRKIFPIVQWEVKSIIDDEIKELEEAISRARGVINSEVDRELTDEERSTILKNIVKLVDGGLRVLSSRLWNDTVSSLGNSDTNVEVSVESTSRKEYDCSIKSFYKDDSDILNIRKNFSSDVRKHIRGRFLEMLKDGYKFSDGTTIDRSPWVSMSRRLLPIAREEIEPILAEERVKLSDVLLRVQVAGFSPEGSSVTRILTPKERVVRLEVIMKCEHRQSAIITRRVWENIIIEPVEEISLNFPDIYKTEAADESKIVQFGEEIVPPADFNDLSELCKDKFDSIRLEFVGKLGSVISKVVDLSFLGVDITSSILDRIKSDVAVRSCSLFREGGFLSRVKLLLSEAQVVGSLGNDRFLTEKEKRSVFRKFMDSITSDRDYLVENRIVKSMKNQD
ncbi:hypothetical protein [Candidatus Ichthyocystis hellenicum]|uniref:hypothetical protein n=1 Tax=Candidatus Ichthyocystis hellenicum TaxID=1561003 RepID=UPI000B88FCFA|nr:hypothetical protein [Candidatus Ichthyocystis hellenicum]